jgi:TRAP transporter solute receptor, dctP family
MKKRLLALGLSALMALSLTACSSGGDQSSKKVQLKMSVTISDTSTWGQAAKKFADEVKEKTNGRIEIQVVANEQLSGGNQAKGVEQLSTGATDISIHSNIIYSVLDPRFSVPSLPFLITSGEQADEKLAGEAGAAINDILLEKNIIGLGFGESGFREITNNKQPITKLDDLKGMKIRVPGMKMYVDLFKSLGADPISMNFAEVFTSLQQGAIDGQENPLDVIDSNQIYTVQKYMSMWDYSYDMLILGFNKTKFESLSPEDQEIIRSAAKDAMAYQRELVRELAKEQLEKFKQSGVEVTELKDIDVDSFKTAVEPLYQGYEQEYGADLINKFR